MKRHPGYLGVILMLAATELASLLTGRAPASAVRPGSFPLQLAGWSGQELAPFDQLTNDMLKPDSYFNREYRDRVGKQVFFSVVWGHRKQTFHSPGFCLLGGGWEIISKRVVPIDTPDQPVVMANSFLLQKGMERSLMTYLFLVGERSTPSWLRLQLGLTENRLLGRPAWGALVRVVSPVEMDPSMGISAQARLAEEKAEQVNRQFLAATLPLLRSQMR